MVLDNVAEGGVAQIPTADAQDIQIPGHSSIQGLFTSALVDQQVVADDGNLYDTVQAAENAASGWIFTPPGTFSESVTIDTPGLMVIGSGDSTLISGGSSQAIDITSSNVILYNLSVESSGTHGITQSGAGDSTLNRVRVVTSSGEGIQLNGGSGNIVFNCIVVDSGNTGIRIGQDLSILSSSIIKSAGDVGVRVPFGETVVSNCIIINSSSDGIDNSGDDCMIVGNRVIGSGGKGIDMRGVDQIVADNRVSGSSGADIDTNGATNLTQDSNLTGASN